MKKRTITFFLILFVALFSFSACDNDDGVSSGTLAGNYFMNYMMDKLSGITYYSGQATEVEDGVTISMTQNLTLTESTYSMTMQMSMTSALGNFDETVTETGTYTTSGSNMTVTPSPTDEGEPQTFTYSLSGNQLTLENDENKIVFDKR